MSLGKMHKEILTNHGFSQNPLVPTLIIQMKIQARIGTYPCQGVIAEAHFMFSINPPTHLSLHTDLLFPLNISGLFSPQDSCESVSSARNALSQNHSIILFTILFQYLINCLLLQRIFLKTQSKVTCPTISLHLKLLDFCSWYTTLPPCHSIPLYCILLVWLMLFLNV